ncbi:YbhB/YbcL family Raf kinase inhibitor-like protein [Gandjariella thermophila]|uniref:YbhB/YbcL family Raf kinase inhibitor-like protein n=1 Tax=Gandjariella thermophila TaxID=1931992 RepID=UPI0010F802CA|nr:YbhB/YbcL family Raf kinase inhibitor-like protein [Gandjariella thermophila]
MQRDNPPQPVGPGDRAGRPRGTRGTSRDDPSADEFAQPHAGGLVLRSSAFSDHAVIPDRYSFEGGNTSPPLEWADLPPGTRELALVCEDPDAPGGTFVHWVLAGISPETGGIAEGRPPEGAVVGRNGFGRRGWGGPRPPVGDQPHRYFFRLYASDRPLDLGPAPSADDLRAAVSGHELATGTLVGLFAR